MSNEDYHIISCPGCKKKYRLRKPMRFKCKRCQGLIDASNISDIQVYEEIIAASPDVLRGTREELAGSFEDIRKKSQPGWFASPGRFFARLAYWFDSFISRGPLSMFFLLTFSFFSVLTLCWVLYQIAGCATGTTHQIWLTFLQLSDPGYLDNATDRPATVKLLAVVTWIMGVVIFSTLIAFLTNIFDQKLQDLKKGHSSVIEDGHTLILGWNDKVLSILRELIIANESERKATVVILAPKPKEWLEDYLRNMLKKRATTKIIVRSGEITNIASLEQVAISHCKSVIIVSEAPKYGNKMARTLSDTQAIKTILTICKNPARRLDPFHITAEIHDPRNIDIMRSIGEDEVIVLYGNETIAKILVQTSRQNGLATVYNELLSFAGNEIYCVQEKKTEGCQFRDVIYQFPSCIPIGIKKAEHPAKINPPLNSLVHAGDQIILIAEDDSTVYYKKIDPPKTGMKLTGRKLPKPLSERHLLLGWNDRSENIIAEYGDYLCEGSEIHIVVPLPPREVKDTCRKLDGKFSKIRVQLIEKDYRLRHELEKIKPFSYDNIIILASGLKEAISVEEIDSQTIYTLLLLRDMQAKSGKGKDVKLITELLNPANQELIQIAKVNDFVISDQLISMMIAQVSEQKVMYEVYHDLFRAKGSEIYLKPASLYFSQFPVELTFYDIMEVILQRGEIPFGYRIDKWGNQAELNFGININPDKEKKILLEKEDRIIVVAEDEF